MLLLLALACTPKGAPDTGGPPDGVDSGDTAVEAAPRSEVLVHLFEWPWESVALECERVLGPAGIGGVQVSPPQEYRLLEGSPWYERYQPVSYALIGRSGDEAAFAEMVARCGAAGVEVYVDAVLNHMAWANAEEGYQGVGYAGTEFSRYDFPGLYSDEHFHDCRRGIEDWGSVWEIQSCELATLPDLATEHPHVRETLAAYLGHLVALGVAGFRVDAAKHIPAEDLAAIFAALPETTSVFQEVIVTSEGEVVRPEDYTPLGRVTEFRYSAELGRVFTEGQLSWLHEYGRAWGFLPSESALVFVDNHDNQRGHSYGDPVTHQRPELYRLANAFMLAWPYGRPKLMSSYAFTDGDEGPPTDGAAQGDRVTPVHDGEGACVEPWQCEHRWSSTLGMVGFRVATEGAPVEGWWDNGNDQIAFSRGALGFVALNREELPSLSQRFETGLPAGRYCDVMSGGVSADGASCEGALIEVTEHGEADVTVGPLDGLALHVGARLP